MNDEVPSEEFATFQRHRQLCWIMALAGALPFIIPAAIGVVLGAGNPLTPSLLEVFRTYSVVILSFLGGIRWGHALVYQRDEKLRIANASMLISVVPALVAWGTVFLDNRASLAVLILAYAAQGAWDSLSANAGKLPNWFANLRMVLTFIVVACHLAIFAVAS